MLRLRSIGLSAAALCAGLSLSLHAHEDDPKLLDREPPVPGTGLRTGVPPPGARLGGVKSSSFTSNQVTLLSWLTLGELSPIATGGNDCWGYTSPSGREYALMGVSSGTAFVEITDPNDPQVVSFKAGPPSTWRDIKVFGTHVYAVSEGGNGIQIFGVAGIDSGTVTSEGSVTTGGNTTHNVAIDTDSGFLYRTGGSGNGLLIYDLNASPTNPPLVGTWSTKYVHDAQVLTYTSGPQAGKQIAYCCSGFNGGFTQTGLSILDVTDKANIVVLDEVFWPGAAYSHQVWLSQDLQYAYLDDEGDEGGGNPTTTYVIDVADPASAFLIGSFDNGNTAVGHNLFTTDDRLFEANYKSGLRVFDIGSNPVDPAEVAWFDTYPASDSTGFNGLWGVYPYFESGVVIGSDTVGGLFVWWVGNELIEIEPMGGAGLAWIHPSGESMAVTIDELTPGTLVPGTAKLHYDLGAGVVSTDLTFLGGNQWSASFPVQPCGTQVDYFVSAQSTNGTTWSWPQGGSSAPQHAVYATAAAIAFEDTLEVDSGWTVGAAGDNATDGIWTWVDPVGTAAQPEDDHTSSPGAMCFVTGQGVQGGGLGDDDVDGGTTTLVSPALDTTGVGEAHVGYWRWFSNNQSGAVDDSLTVEVSNGGAWFHVETVGPSDPESVGGWFYHQFRVADFVAPNTTVQVRFRASDTGQSSTVEAAVDDLRVVHIECKSDGIPLTYCTAKINSNLCLPWVGYSGTPSATSPDPFLVTANQIVPNTLGIGIYGYAQNNAPFQGGTLCVGGVITRMSGQFSGGSGPCSGSFAYDFNQVIQGGSDASLVSGASVDLQFWYRDTPASFGSGLSNAIDFLIQP